MAEGKEINDTVSLNFIKDIAKTAESVLRRQLTNEEIQKINRPRSYMGFEAILDYLKYSNDEPDEIEKYLSEL